MASLSIVVPVHNNATTISETLQSAVRAIGCLREHSRFAQTRTEVVVVDDGSTDETLAVVVDCTRGDDQFKIFHRPSASNPACARNSGVNASEGELLFFLDGDDLFYEDHLYLCCEIMQDSSVGLVKTRAALSADVHPDWYGRIGNSLVLNLCVRRACHDFVGGFPDYHIYLRTPQEFEPYLDVFRMIEDVHYNHLLSRFFRMESVRSETVLYQRRPGNSFDRQFQKFQQPYGVIKDPADDEFDLRVRISKLLIDYQVQHLERVRGTHVASGGRGQASSEILALTAGKRISVIS